MGCSWEATSHWDRWSSNDYLQFSPDRKVYTATNSTASSTAGKIRIWSSNWLCHQKKALTEGAQTAIAWAALTLNFLNAVFLSLHVLVTPFLEATQTSRVWTTGWKALPSSDSRSPLAFAELEMWAFPPLPAPSPPASGESSSQILWMINCSSSGNSVMLALSLWVSSQDWRPDLSPAYPWSQPCLLSWLFCHSKYTFPLEAYTFWGLWTRN